MTTKQFILLLLILLLGLYGVFFFLRRENRLVLEKLDKASSVACLGRTVCVDGSSSIASEPLKKSASLTPKIVRGSFSYFKLGSIPVVLFNGLEMYSNQLTEWGRIKFISDRGVVCEDENTQTKTILLPASPPPPASIQGAVGGSPANPL